MTAFQWRGTWRRTRSHVHLLFAISFVGTSTYGFLPMNIAKASVVDSFPGRSRCAVTWSPAAAKAFNSAIIGACHSAARVTGISNCKPANELIIPAFLPFGAETRRPPVIGKSAGVQPAATRTPASWFISPIGSGSGKMQKANGVDANGFNFCTIAACTWGAKDRGAWYCASWSWAFNASALASLESATALAVAASFADIRSFENRSRAPLITIAPIVPISTAAAPTINTRLDNQNRKSASGEVTLHISTLTLVGLTLVCILSVTAITAAAYRAIQAWQRLRASHA